MARFSIAPGNEPRFAPSAARTGFLQCAQARATNDANDGGDACLRARLADPLQLRRDVLQAAGYLTIGLLTGAGDG